ncbi:hypothetical protein Bxe_B1731 [Paraburkholderia xenovorans LB400]|uniref:Uncharacterized protein n=1 Tax=Paraburkholderia xenovorans (strain LB400) TaxID=266265 RepID=Q13NV4_PARXL|nr:hypothetical protein Bxe_B1731 [Paraburkholderia xenovorans LB400]
MFVPGVSALKEVAGRGFRRPSVVRNRQSDWRRPARLVAQPAREFCQNAPHPEDVWRSIGWRKVNFQKGRVEALRLAKELALHTYRTQLLRRFSVPAAITRPPLSTPDKAYSRA